MRNALRKHSIRGHIRSHISRVFIFQDTRVRIIFLPEPVSPLSCCEGEGDGIHSFRKLQFQGNLGWSCPGTRPWSCSGFRGPETRSSGSDHGLQVVLRLNLCRILWYFHQAVFSLFIFYSIEFYSQEHTEFNCTCLFLDVKVTIYPFIENFGCIQYTPFTLPF